jgi:FkbM family methyltransferase
MIFDFLQKDDLVFDVGANKGQKANVFLEYTDKVVCFEPQPHCLPYLEMLDVPVEVIALDEKKGTATLYEADADTISSMSREFIANGLKERFKDNKWYDKPIEVETDTLDNMIEKYGVPKFIKIDVEGYELNVLKGLTKDVEYISIEFTPELLEQTIACLDYLKYNAKYNYGSQENTEFTFDEWITKEEMIKFLSSIHDHKIEFGDIYIKLVY